GDMCQQVPAGADLVEGPGDVGGVAQIASHVSCGRRVVGLDVDRDDMLATVVEVRRGRGADSGTRTHHHDPPRFCAHDLSSLPLSSRPLDGPTVTRTVNNSGLVDNGCHSTYR